MSRVQAQLVVATVAIALSFLASAWVHAISRLSMARARRLEREQPRRGRLLVAISENPRPYLASAVLTMLVAEVSGVVAITWLVRDLGVPFAGAISVAVMAFVLFQVAEVAPRSWVIERPEKVMLISARPVWLLGTLLRPLASVLVRMNRLFLLILPGRGLPKSPLTSEEEIMSMLEVAESEEVIETQEREMIHSIFEFGDTVVREVMVPRPDIASVDAKASLDVVLDTALENGFSRLPVIRGGEMDDIMGIVHVRDVVKRLHNGSRRAARAADVAREAMFVPESKKVAELLREMQKAKTQMAIVVDEYGGTAGLVTMEDLLEEIVGEIADEYDREEPPIERLDERTVRVNGRLDIDELNEYLGVHLPNHQWDSVGGLVGGLLGRLPAAGDVVRHDELEFEVESMKGRRIEKVLVRLLAEGREPAREA